GQAADARTAAERAISAGAGGDEPSLRALIARLAEAAGQKETAAENARWIAVHAPARDEAANAESMLQRIEPSDPPTRKECKNRADRLADAGRVEDALAELDRAAKATSPATQEELDWARASILYKSRGHYDKAAAAYDKLSAKKGPRQSEALFYAARAK